MPEDHLVDLLGRDARAAHDLRDHMGGESCGPQTRQPTAETPDGGAERFADDDIGLTWHVVAFPVWADDTSSDLSTGRLIRSNIRSIGD
ncbi:hypothetical protein GCM10010381_03890 [Streptomyces xantholiticus]|nr:hypothetical protein GCM10010381_03890 [Streptomyces xantholiticus]